LALDRHAIGAVIAADGDEAADAGRVVLRAPAREAVPAVEDRHVRKGARDRRIVVEERDQARLGPEELAQHARLTAGSPEDGVDHRRMNSVTASMTRSLS